jgi:hypothetical protein
VFGVLEAVAAAAAREKNSEEVRRGEEVVEMPRAITFWRVAYKYSTKCSFFSRLLLQFSLDSVFFFTLDSVILAAYELFNAWQRKKREEEALDFLFVLVRF